MPSRVLDVSSLATDRPIRALLIVFIAWKSLLLFVTLCSPGTGYDTSTDIALAGIDSSTVTSRIVQRLTRWDSLYFISSASRGYVFEQEWAFGWGYSKSLGTLTQVFDPFLRSISGDNRNSSIALVGVVLSHFSHLAAVLLLNSSTIRAFQSQTYGKEVAFIASVLHILSPAGLFLSAPYAEAPFAALHFLGHWLYFYGIRRTNSLHGASAILGAGLSFAIATTFRSNGILSGPLLAEIPIVAFLGVINGSKNQSKSRFLWAVVPAIIAGLTMIAGFGLPQIVAWKQFCAESIEGRPWCSRRIPSIYTWVQDYYWEVGFFRYWKVSNIPLFLLALPTLAILYLSSAEFLRGWASLLNPRPNYDAMDGLGQHTDDISRRAVGMIAFVQLLLAVLALIQYHVQIITRISSGYMLWYWWLARLIVQDRRQGKGPNSVLSRTALRWMIIYALVQGGLFASFLPPA